MHCNQCGHEIKEDDSYCPKCGSPVNGTKYVGHGYPEAVALLGLIIIFCICIIILRKEGFLP